MKQSEQIIRCNEPCLQSAAKAACQGVAGAFSHTACLTVFEQPNITFYPTFEDVFQAVSNQESEYGVIPIENSLAGSVTDNYDLMLRYHLHIVGTVKVKVEHSLLVLPGTKIEQLRHVYSHEQALHQCSDFLKAHSQITHHPYSNTAASAQFVAKTQDASLAAIGSSESAKRYGLEILHQNIQNRRDNFTRFVILAREPISHPECNRISLIIRLKHQAGSLYQALSRFAQQEINLLKLESRPIPDSPFEFLFYWDFDGNLMEPRVQKALKDLEQDIEYMKLLGNYPEF